MAALLHRWRCRQLRQHSALHAQPLLVAKHTKLQQTPKQTASAHLLVTTVSALMKVPSCRSTPVTRPLALRTALTAADVRTCTPCCLHMLCSPWVTCKPASGQDITVKHSACMLLERQQQQRCCNQCQTESINTTAAWPGWFRLSYNMRLT
jgi:hypothetical protein